MNKIHILNTILYIRKLYIFHGCDTLWMQWNKTYAYCIHDYIVQFMWNVVFKQINGAIMCFRKTGVIETRWLACDQRWQSLFPSDYENHTTSEMLRDRSQQINTRFVYPWTLPTLYCHGQHAHRPEVCLQIVQSVTIVVDHQTLSWPSVSLSGKVISSGVPSAVCRLPYDIFRTRIRFFIPHSGNENIFNNAWMARAMR